MTKSELKKLKKWLSEDKRRIISGYFTLFPQAIKFIGEKASSYNKEKAEQGRTLFISCHNGKIEDNNLLLFCNFDGKMKIPFNYIQKCRIYDYN